MTGVFFSIESKGIMEHTCSPSRVTYFARITSKSVKLICDNCHREYFYRLVPLEAFTIGQKQFLEDLKSEIDNSSTPMV